MSLMQPYHDLLHKALTQGIDQFNKRTGKICRAIPGEQVVFDLREGFPALTTRKLPFKNIVGELLGFFRGVTNAKDFRELGCHFWDQNANETKAWLENPYRKGTDDLGRIYGKNWTEWETIRVANSIPEEYYLNENGWKWIGKTSSNYEQGSDFNIYRKTINQLENAVRTILTNPSDRRIIIEGWNVGDLDRMALVPCHKTYTFVPFEDSKIMHVVMGIRSWDLFLGSPANIASTAIFLEVMCRLTGYTPGTVTIQAVNAHIYDDHFEQVIELLGREHFDPPKLILSENIQPITSLDKIEGCFKRIEPSDITMEGYQSHAAIKAPMAA